MIIGKKIIVGKHKILLKQLPNKSDKNGVININSNKPGKTISIVGLTHGNEFLSLYVFDYLLNNYKIH